MHGKFSLKYFNLNQKGFTRIQKNITQKVNIFEFVVEYDHLFYIHLVLF